MPDRIIRESANTSESLAALSDFAERLFWRLTTVSDDYGCWNANAAVIRGRCMPLVANATERRIEAALEEMARVQSARFYEVDGKRYGHFVNWARYQRPREGSKRKFPEPPPFAESRGDSPRGAALSVSVSENVKVSENGNGAAKPKLQSKRPEKSETLFPEGFELTPALREYVSKKNHENGWHLDAQKEFDKFRLHALDKRPVHRDWSLAFQRWILNADRFSSNGNEGKDVPQGSWAVPLHEQVRIPPAEMEEIQQEKVRRRKLREEREQAEAAENR
jgi:hypothetical protein